MEILGVRIDNFSEKELLEKVESFLREDSFHQIVTINPEFILEAQKDHGFREVLNGSDLCLADGAGIWFAFLRHGKILRSRMAGADLMEEILGLASTNGQGIFLAASDKSLSTWEETRDAILKKYPGLKIEGERFGPQIANHGLPLADCSIVLCNFGAPHQEKFIRSLKRQENSRIRLAIGVGGGFDFLTGKVARAPKIFRTIGLEWLWRFLQEPRYRARRIFRAVVVFPIRIIFDV
jgi:N-acetylglucosaminyldiphosphoundecaprenol N-acetyl-beta-D-mannosaminyltransferase